MVQSMTGYGRAEALLDGGHLTVEIRSVNGKNAEISLRTSLIPKEQELPLRRKLASRLQRGTVDLFLTWEAAAEGAARALNGAAALEYYRQVERIGREIGAVNLPLHEPNVLLAALLRLPGVVDEGRQNVITPENWPLVDAAIDRALDALVEYRKHEGEALREDVSSRVQTILELEDEVEGFEAERISSARSRLLKAAEDVSIRLDPERFEQEMVYYLEKYDINEEKVRLRTHCRYFLETLDGEEQPGRKLGFILQEMGREINTTGSKANHSGIQKAVVRMKDELEKIREQSLNIL